MDTSEDKDLCIQILAIISLAYRSITLSELVPLFKTSQEVDDDLKTLEEIVNLYSSFLTLQDQTIYLIHQSAKDYLSRKEPGAIFPSSIQTMHQSILQRSLDAMAQALQRDIYNLQHPGTSIEKIEPPHPDPLAPI